MCGLRAPGPIRALGVAHWLRLGVLVVGFGGEDVRILVEFAEAEGRVGRLLDGLSGNGGWLA